MNKARREVVNGLLQNDGTLTPKEAYDLTRKFKFAGALKKRLADKGVNVSKRRSFSPDELEVVQKTMDEMLAEKTSVVEEVQNEVSKTE